jgi:hydrogenase 3 maturation protease
MDGMKMSGSSWKSQLSRVLSLKFLANNERPLRLVLVGVGNEFQSDDIAGLLVIRALEMRLTSSPRLLLIEGGMAPENFTGKIRHFNPDYVLMIDAADMEAAAGEVHWLTAEEIDGVSASSHTLPLSVLAHFIRVDIGCEVGILGIQAAGLELYVPAAEEVCRAAEELALDLIELTRGVR